jgi:poly(3-hydroxybutyrate) depolymerase
MGHHWPGGRGQLNPRLAGPLVESFNLNRALLEFFDKIANVES